MLSHTLIWVCVRACVFVCRFVQRNSWLFILYSFFILHKRNVPSELSFKCNDISLCLFLLSHHPPHISHRTLSLFFFHLIRKCFSLHSCFVCVYFFALYSRGYRKTVENSRAQTHIQINTCVITRILAASKKHIFPIHGRAGRWLQCGRSELSQF